MLSHLIRKELLNHILSIRFLILSAMGIIVIWLSLYDGYAYYQDRLRDFRLGQELTEERVRQLAKSDWLELGNFGFQKHKHPSLLGIFVRGLTPVQGRSISNAYSTEKRLRKSPTEAEPALGIFPGLDLGFVVEAVLSLLALLLSYDVVCGEKEGGTLRLLGSFSLPRYQLLLAKYIGILLPSLLAFGLPLLLGIAVLLLMPEIQFMESDWTRLIGILITFAVYLSTLVCAGLLASSLTHRSATSFVLLLTFWIASVVVIPRVSLIMADQIRPAPSIHAYHAKRKALSSKYLAEWQEIRAKWVEEFERSTGRRPWDTPEGGETYRFMHIQTREEMHEKLDPAQERLEEEFQNQYNARLSLATTLGRFSPSFAFKHAAIRLAETDIESHQRFENAFTQDYMDKYVHWVWKTVDLNQFRKANPAKYGEFRWDISDIPRFIYTKQSPEAALQSAMVDVGVLLLWGLVFFAGAYVIILRYDIR